ncbi:Guanylate-binding protein, partial [Globisporangium splendens]
MGEEPVRPIPFVLVADDGSFSVNPEACERIEKIKGKLVVIAVAGLYRTGKSFLLNLLVRHAHDIDNAGVAADAMDAMEAGFAVGGTVNACTKGIWMWGEPIVMKDGTSYLFLDTEGLGSVDREQTHDTRIFALALLLATNFIYNSRGVIDGNAIEDLSLVVNLSKHIQTSSSQKESSGADLYEFFPSFMWVVRDFTLQLLDNGKKISSKQYLENALKPQGGYSDDAVAKDQIRVLLSDFFRQRDCVTLVRPVDDEQKLRTLPKVPYEELRDEFRSSFETLRKRLFDKAKPKMLYGKILNGAMYTNLVQSYVEALNSGKAPVISSAWSRVVQAQCDDALADSIELYKKEIASRIRVYTSPEQYEKDADFEDEERNRNTLSPIDYGQGDNVMFDEYGNLRNVEMKAANPQTDEEGQESEMIEVMEEDDGEEQVKIERTRLPCAEDTLMHVHKICKRIAKKRLREVVDSDISDDASQYLDQFRVSINGVFDMFKQQNAAASMAYCRHLLDKLGRPGKEYLEDIEGNSHKSAMELHREMQEYLQGAIENVYDEYFSRAIGPSADAAYCEFVTQTVVGQVIQRTESSNVAHMTEVRALEKEMNDMSVKVAIAQGQASAMQELSLQQRQKCELTVKEAEQRCANEISALRATLEFKTNELEHVLNHNATLKRLADTAQQGQYRATEFVTSTFATVLAGYLIKQQVMPGQVPSKAKWQQRYFVLQGNQLSFYDTKDDYERCRSDNPPMDVTGAIIEDSYVIPEAFSISFAENKYFPLHLHAKSLETKKEWVDSLRRASVSSRASSYGTLSMSSSRYMQM